MPLTGPASFPPTANLFIAHWATANDALGAAGPLAVGGGLTLASLSGLRDTLEDQRAAVEAARNGVDLARADIESRKAALLARLNQFNLKLAADGAGNIFLAMRPRAFSQSDGIGKVTQPLDDLADLWDRYNAARPAAPLTLMGGYARATFVTDLAALKAAYPAAGRAAMDLRFARALRNETQEKIRPILIQYRQRVASEFPPGSPVPATLPILTPPAGSTPDAVELTGTWQADTGDVRLVWTPVTDADVTTLELRATSGSHYEADDESLLASFRADVPSGWTGAWGLATPGAAATFKLYSLTAEGREHGSNPVTITRPAG